MRDLVKWKPREVADRRGWDSLFDWNPFESFNRDFFNVFEEAVTYLDDDKNVVVELEVPGFNKDNIDIELSGGVLNVKGEREVKTECYVGRKSINKRYSIGEYTDATATVNDGILKIVITTPSEEKKSIEVK
jgi:HSP20 family molecular chaperone IbpA